MNTVVYVPFVASLLVAGLSRAASSRLWPRAASWAIAGTALALSVSTVGALVLLASPLPARVPLVATLGEWKPHAVASHSPVPVAVSLAALVVLAALTWRTARELHRLGHEAWDAYGVAGVGRDGLVVIDDARPGAHAVGLGITGRGGIIVSSAMLALLDGDERDAVVAHERAHLQERHALFLAIVRLAAAANPLVTSMRADLRFSLERRADEAAALTTERAVVASALAKTALGALGALDRAADPRPGFAFHRLGVTDRVAALLAAPDRRTQLAWWLGAVAVVAGLALAWATHDTERFFEAVRLWSRR